MDDVPHVVARFLADAQAKVGTLLQAELVGAVRAFCARLEHARDDAAARERLVREQPGAHTLREAFAGLVDARMGAFSSKLAARLKERIDEDLSDAVLCRLATALPGLFEGSAAAPPLVLMALAQLPPGLAADAAPSQPGPPQPWAGPVQQQQQRPHEALGSSRRDRSRSRSRSRSRERGGAPSVVTAPYSRASVASTTMSRSDAQQQQQQQQQRAPQQQQQWRGGQGAETHRVSPDAAPHHYYHASAPGDTRTAGAPHKYHASDPAHPQAASRPPAFITTTRAAALQPPPLPPSQQPGQLSPPPGSRLEPLHTGQKSTEPPPPPGSRLEPLRTGRRMRGNAATGGDGSAAWWAPAGSDAGSGGAFPHATAAALPPRPASALETTGAVAGARTSSTTPTTVRLQSPREVLLGVQSSEILCAYFAAGQRHSNDCRFDHMPFKDVHWHVPIAPSAARVARRFQTSPPLFQVTTDHGPRYVDAAHARLIDVADVRERISTFLRANRDAFNAELERLASCSERIDEHGHVEKPASSPPAAVTAVAAAAAAAAAAGRTAVVVIDAAVAAAAGHAAAAAVSAAPPPPSSDAAAAGDSRSHHHLEPDTGNSSPVEGEDVPEVRGGGAAAPQPSSASPPQAATTSSSSSAGGGSGAEMAAASAAEAAGGSGHIVVDSPRRSAPGGDYYVDGFDSLGGVGGAEALQQVCIRHAENPLACPSSACRNRHVRDEVSGTGVIVGHVVNPRFVPTRPPARATVANPPLLLVIRFPPHTGEPGVLSPPRVSILHRFVADAGPALTYYFTRFRTRINQDLFASRIRQRVRPIAPGQVQHGFPLEEYGGSF